MKERVRRSSSSGTATSSWSSAASTAMCVSAAARDLPKTSTRGTQGQEALDGGVPNTARGRHSPRRARTRSRCGSRQGGKEEAQDCFWCAPRCLTEPIPYLFSFLHPSYPVRISHAPLRVSDQVEATHISSSSPLSTNVLARFGPLLTSLQLSRRSAAQQLCRLPPSTSILISSRPHLHVSGWRCACSHQRRLRSRTRLAQSSSGRLGCVLSPH